MHRYLSVADIYAEEDPLLALGGIGPNFDIIENHNHHTQRFLKSLTTAH